jgi:hypothetical protein
MKTRLSFQLGRNYQTKFSLNFSWGRASLYNLFATFLTVGEPAPTGLLRMVQYLSLNLSLNCLKISDRLFDKISSDR